MQHIIILDPSEEYARTYGSIIKEIGDFEVFWAASYEAYMAEEERRTPVALVIADLQLPDTTQGLHALRRMRLNPRLMAVPVIVVTELPEREGRGICAGLDVSDYILKPFRTERLRKTLIPLLNQPGDYSGRFSEAEAVMLPPLEYMERELRIAVRMKSALSLLIITRLSLPDAARPLSEAEDTLVMLRVIRSCLRMTDQAFANEAGDIAVVLPATEAAGAERALRKIAGALCEQIPLPEGHSCDEYYGVAVSYPEDGETLEELIREAFTKIDSKRQLETVSSRLHRNMAQANYQYRRAQRF